MITKTVLVSVLAIASFPAVAYADEVDVNAFEYIDVIETADGSIWKGVITEQTPSVGYKIATADGSLRVLKASEVVRVTKQRNANFRRAAPPPPSSSGDALGAQPQQTTGLPERSQVSSNYSNESPELPPPYARSGLRFDPEVLIVFPTGDLGDYDYKEAFGPGFRVGYESIMGRFGLGIGGLARFIYWRQPEGYFADDSAHWTLETQLYGRAALHVGRAAPYLGLSIGLDTNYTHEYDESDTSLGFGMNLQTGILVAATPMAAFEIGLDIHPGTDTVEPESDVSVSYFALRLGASVRM
ncbi:MAG: hypothetical protein AB7O24_27565 [Kofleriaceae bacterium]